MLSFTAPSSTNFLTKPRLLSPPAARVDDLASDAVKASMSFSSVHFEERQSQGDPRGNVLARFLGSFFAARQRMNIKNRYSERVPQAQCECKEKKCSHKPPN
ncbi:MAG: hypothetical protein E7605_01760 [Ruminococcaceae bacterium]|nr:hypothetical protein [Oscillospiraceae bacterium]